MKISIFFKIFFVLLLAFSIVLFANIYISYERFSPLYIENNISNVKSAILNSASEVESGIDLTNTELNTLSSETSFILYKDNAVLQSIGPKYIEDSEIILFVANIFDSETSTIEDQLTYHVEIVDDIYHINYIYMYDYGHYLIVSTRVQSLQYIDSVLIEINQTQTIFTLVAIIFISFIISFDMLRPINMIKEYAKEISNLRLHSKLSFKRNDEFKELASSLNEMTFNLKKAYQQLDEANQKLASDYDSEKAQEEKKKQLIMTINHEVKTPLAVMKGMIEGMIDGVGRYKDKDKYLKELLKQISTIENMTHDLTYSLKLEDKIKDDDVTNIYDVLKNMESLQLFADQHLVKINQKFEDANLIINQELLTIMISNLVKNAIIYSDDKAISLSGKVANQNYILTVRNKGQIPNEELNKLFNSFYRGINKNKESSGTGLGLHIIKQICEIYDYSYKIFNDGDEVVAKIEIKIKL